MIVLMEAGSTQEEIDMVKNRIREGNLGSMFRGDEERVLIHVSAGDRTQVIEVLSGISPPFIDEQRIPQEHLV